MSCLHAHVHAQALELQLEAARREAEAARCRLEALERGRADEALCAICWEAAKDMAFQCGHQACCGCGSKLASCPSCRQPITQRIRLYS